MTPGGVLQLVAAWHIAATVMADIVVVKRPENKTVEEGSSVMFECMFNGTEEVPSWSIGGLTYGGGHKLPDRHIFKSGILTVSNVSLSDNGTLYECFLGPFDGGNATLTVTRGTSETTTSNLLSISPTADKGSSKGSNLLIIILAAMTALLLISLLLLPIAIGCYCRRRRHVLRGKATPQATNDYEDLIELPQVRGSHNHQTDAGVPVYSAISGEVSDSSCLNTLPSKHSNINTEGGYYETSNVGKGFHGSNEQTQEVDLASESSQNKPPVTLPIYDSVGQHITAASSSYEADNDNYSSLKHNITTKNYPSLATRDSGKAITSSYNEIQNHTYSCLSHSMKNEKSSAFADYDSIGTQGKATPSAYKAKDRTYSSLTNSIQAQSNEKLSAFADYDSIGTQGKVTPSAYKAKDRTYSSLTNSIQAQSKEKLSAFADYDSIGTQGTATLSSYETKDRTYSSLTNSIQAKSNEKLSAFVDYDSIGTRGTATLSSYEAKERTYSSLTNRIRVKKSSEFADSDSIDTHGTVNLGSPTPTTHGTQGTMTLSSDDRTYSSLLKHDIRANNNEKTCATTNQPREYEDSAAMRPDEAQYSSLYHATEVSCYQADIGNQYNVISRKNADNTRKDVSEPLYSTLDNPQEANEQSLAHSSQPYYAPEQQEDHDSNRMHEGKTNSSAQSTSDSISESTSISNAVTKRTTISCFLEGRNNKQ